MPKVVDHAQRRRELVNACMDLVAREGLDAATMRRIADEAGCTTGRITHYFDNREDLIVAALRAAHRAAGRRMVEAAARDIPHQQKILEVLEITLPFDAERMREWKVWIAFWAAGASMEMLAKENEARYAEWQSMMQDLTAPLLGVSPESRDAQDAARTLMGLTDGLGLRLALNPTPANMDAAHRLMKAYIDGMDVPSHAAATA